MANQTETGYGNDLDGIMGIGLRPEASIGPNISLPFVQLFAHLNYNNDLAGWKLDLPVDGPGWWWKLSGESTKGSSMIIHSGRWRFYKGHNGEQFLFESGPKAIPHLSKYYADDKVDYLVCVGY